MAPRIEAQEIETYWNIFSTRTNGGKFLTGEQAAPLLKNSGLRDDQLERALRAGLMVSTWLTELTWKSRDLQSLLSERSSTSKHYMKGKSSLSG